MLVNPATHTPPQKLRNVLDAHGSRLLCLLSFAAFTLSGCASRGDVAADGTLIEEPDAPRTQVDVSGVDGVSLDKAIVENVNGFVSVAREACDAPDWRVERRATRIEDEADRGLRALGYYSSTIEHSVERRDDCWAVDIRIDPGEPVRVDAVDVRISGDASDDAAFATLLESPPIGAGEVLNHGKYEALKAALNDLAAERGYLDAEFTRSELRVNPDTRKADVQLDFESGERRQFGTFTLEQDALDDDLAKRIAKFPEGEPYSAMKLNEVNARLSNSGYFDTVFLTPDLDAPVGEPVDVSASAEARPEHRYIAGAGVTSDEGPRVRLGYENRRLNKRGHRLRLDARGSFIEREASAQYTIPLDDPAEEQLSFEAGFRETNNDDIETVSGRLGARRTARRFGDWRETLSLFYTLDDFEVGVDSGRTGLLVPGVNYTLTQADKPLRPTRGFRVSVGLSGASDAILSDVSFLRGIVELSGVYAVSDSNRFLARTSLGAILTDGFHDLPPAQRFFAGGDVSVRGYGFQSLGPEDENGDVLGGEFLGTASLEFEHAFTSAWSGAAFVDTGTAFDGSMEGAVGVGVGLGARWQSPVGPVRVDLAHPLTESDDLVRLHLRLGPDL